MLFVPSFGGVPQEEALQAARSAAAEACAAPAPPSQPSPAPPPNNAAAATATTASASAAIGMYMRAAGTLKLREEADSFSIELGTVAAGELVRVEEVGRIGWHSSAWVRGGALGWI